MDKIFKPESFAESVYNYQILPDIFVNLTGLMLPWLELVLGLMLVAGIWLPGAVFLSTLLLAFSSILIFNLYRELNISCGCFSAQPSTDPITWRTVLRDALILIPAGCLLFVNRAGKRGAGRDFDLRNRLSFR